MHCRGHRGRGLAASMALTRTDNSNASAASTRRVEESRRLLDAMSGGLHQVRRQRCTRVGSYIRRSGATSWKIDSKTDKNTHFVSTKPAMHH